MSRRSENNDLYFSTIVLLLNKEITMSTMKKTKLALAMSLTTLLAVGCGSSSSGGGEEEETYVDTVFDIENTYWDLAADAVSATAIDSDDVIAYYFEGSADDTTGTLKIYSDAGFVTSDYTITAAESETDVDSIAFDVAVAAEVDGEEDTTLAVTCDFAVDETTEALTLSSCDTADYDAEIAPADADTILVLAALEEIEDEDDGGEPGGETPTEATADVDFDFYSVGQVISDVSDSWATANMKDNSDGLGTTTAEVSDAQSSSGDNSLFLEDLHSNSKPFAYREFADGPATSGSVTFDVYTPATNTKVTYINVGTSKDNSGRYFEIRLNKDDLEYEDSANGDVDLATDGFAMAAWHTITIAWTVENMVTVTLDDTTYDAIDQTTLGLEGGTPSQLTIYTGDNSSNVNTAYFDNIASDLFTAAE